MAERPDLAAMMLPLARTLTNAELPVLERYGLTMWAYVVLLHLDDEPVRTQAAFAERSVPTRHASSSISTICRSAD